MQKYDGGHGDIAGDIKEWIHLYSLDWKHTLLSPTGQWDRHQQKKTDWLNDNTTVD